MTRRHFLQSGSTLLLLGSVGGMGFVWNKFDREVPTAIAGIINAQFPQGAFAIFSDRAEILRAWNVGFIAHSTFQNPARLWQIAGVEKYGTQAAVLDTRGPGEVRKIQAPQGMKFYGHGVFSASGDQVIFSATPQKGPVGFLIIYDLTTLKPVSQVLTGGHFPHDLQYDLTDPRLLILSNAGSVERDSTLTWISPESGHLEKQILMSNSDLRSAHFQQRPDGKIYVNGYNIQMIKNSAIHKPATFGIYREGQGTVQMISDLWSDDFHGEVLNVFVDEKSDRLWLSLPFAHKLMVLDQKDFAKVAVFDLPSPRALIPTKGMNSNLLAVTTGEKSSPKNFYFNLETVSAVTRDENHFYAFHAIPSKGLN